MTENDQNLLKLIKEGENQKVEFKETFRWDVQENSKNKNLKKEVSKAACALLNSKGGIVFIGVDNSGNIQGMERDLITYNPSDIMDAKDKLYIDINKTLREDLGHNVKDNIDFSYETLLNQDIVVLKIKPSAVPIFHSEKLFYVRDGPSSIEISELIKFYGYLISHFELIEGFKREKYEIPTTLDGFDERILLIEKIIKNLMIRFYTSIRIHNRRDRSISPTIYNLTRILNNFDNAYLDLYIRPGTNRPEFRRLAGIFFNTDMQTFEKRIDINEINPDEIKRSIFILAGDLSLEFIDLYETLKTKENIPLKQIHANLLYEIGSENKYFYEQLTFDNFSEAFKLLEDYSLIRFSGEEYKGTDSNTLCEIIDILRLKDFIKWKSINFLLRQA